VRDEQQPFWRHTTPAAVDITVSTNANTFRADFGNNYISPNIHPPAIPAVVLPGEANEFPGLGTDVTSRFRIRVGAPVFTAATGHYRQKVTLQNITGKALSGPLTVQLDGLSH